MEGKKKRRPKIDRSTGEMSVSDVQAMAVNNRDALLDLFQYYLYGIPSSEFDEQKKFKFSRTKLMSLMNTLGYEAFISCSFLPSQIIMVLSC